MLQTSPEPVPTATTILIQPNLDVGSANNWQGTAWDSHIDEFIDFGEEQCKAGAPDDRSSSLGWKAGAPDDRSSSLGWKSYIAGIPQTGAPQAKLSVRRTPRIPIWSCGRNRPRPSTRQTRGSKKRS